MNKNKEQENDSKRLLSNHTDIYRGKSGHQSSKQRKGSFSHQLCRVDSVYKDVRKTSVGEKPVAQREFNNPKDKRTMQVMKGNKTVGHLPHEFPRIAWYFLSRGGEIEVISVEDDILKIFCGNMEIPCQLECRTTGEQDSAFEPEDTNGSCRSHHFYRKQCV